MAPDAPPDDKAPIVDENPTLISYYESLESRLGWSILQGGTRHSGYWAPDTYNPFPISAALRRMEHRLLTRLNLPPGSRVLDAGCGDGQVALYLAEHGGLRVSGIDVVPRHLENCWRNIRRAGAAGAVEVSYADYHHLEHIPDASFDGVYSMETMMHAKDPAAVLAGFFRVLKPGGRIVFHEAEHEAEQGAERVGGGAEIDGMAATPNNEVSRRGFYKRLLEEAGFEEIEQGDYSENIRPLLRAVYAFSIVPYYAIRLFRLERFFINAVASVRSYRQLTWSYIATGATKPGGPIRLKKTDSTSSEV